jgi:asparagine synthetase B (glutamine-hydrolysing)
VLTQYAAHGIEAISEVSGSYLVFIEYDGDARLIADPIRSWECFYTDDSGSRVFGTDAAALAMLLDEPSIRSRALAEFLHMGTVLGNRTLVAGLNRVPFDGGLTESTVESYQRFVYDSQSFDYAEELAARLERSIRRRAHYPGRKGLLLSAGYDSRTFLASLPDMDHCYSIGTADSREMRVARRIATQYDTTHTVLEPDERYLSPLPEKVRYSQGIKESLHIHHAGYTEEIDVDTIYHGLLYDTLFRGYYNRTGGRSLFGNWIPIGESSQPNDVVDALLNQLRDVLDDDALAASASDILADYDVDDPGELIRERSADELEKCATRAESVYDKMALFAIRNQPAKAFRTHLADNYLEALVAADTELLSWHLQTPPGHRSTEVFVRAMRQLDPEILRHPPPDRPHDAYTLNQLERFIRRKLPYIEPFEHAWPDRDSHYDEYCLDQHLFPEMPSIHRLPTREKLRINDARQWIQWVNESSTTTRTASSNEDQRSHYPHTLLGWVRSVMGKNVPSSTVHSSLNR